jgi:hypothetical protein
VPASRGMVNPPHQANTVTNPRAAGIKPSSAAHACRRWRKEGKRRLVPLANPRGKAPAEGTAGSRSASTCVNKVQAIRRCRRSLNEMVAPE